MKFYFALSVGNRIDNKVLFASGAQNYLFSYHYFKGKTYQEEIKNWDRNKNYIVDSGAFSAHTSGKKIHLDNYIKFLKENQFETYANLDVIADPETTIKNENKMKASGLNPLPVFHFGEDVKYLERLLTGEYNYIALGGMVGTDNLKNWLDSVWELIITKQPHLKVHGFGLTNIEHVLSYPWYSVDSSSWCSTVRFGKYSKWNIKRNEFNTQEIHEVFMEHNIEHKKGDPVPKNKREKIMQLQINEYLLAEKYITNKIPDINFKYITNQLNLFL